MESGSLIVMVVGAGAVLMPLVVLSAFRYWSEGMMSCGEAVFTCMLILFIVGLAVTGNPLWSGLTLVILLVSAAIWYSRRVVFIGSGERQFRQEDYVACSRILARDPRNGAALVQMGKLLERDGKDREAMEYYEEALTIEQSEANQRRFEAVRERVALAESGQVKCFGCFTIQPRERGVCWKCGRVFNPRRAVVYRVTQMGWRGKAAFVAVALGAFFLLVSLIAWGNLELRPYTEVLAVVGGVLTIPCAAWLIRRYQHTLREEEEARDH